MILLAVTPVPPPPPIEERRIAPPVVSAPPKLPRPEGPRSDWDFPEGFSLVAGLANPEWAHVGMAYRNKHLGGGVNFGTQAAGYAF